MAALHQTFSALCKHSVQLSTCSVTNGQTCWLVFGSVTLPSDTFDPHSYGVGGVAIWRLQIETLSTGPRKTMSAGLLRADRTAGKAEILHTRLLLWADVSPWVLSLQGDMHLLVSDLRIRVSYRIVHGSSAGMQSVKVP